MSNANHHCVLVETNNNNDNDNNDVYMTRHAARAHRERGWQPLPGRTRNDTELSPRGQEATQQLAASFRHVHHLAHIVFSPFYRCLQTVAPIAKEKGLSHQGATWSL